MAGQAQPLAAGAIIGCCVVWFFMLAGWVIQLAGMGRISYLCMMNKDTEGKKQCGYDLGLDWWTVALQFLVVVLGLVMIFVRQLNAGIVTAIVAISTVQLTVEADKFFKSWRLLDQKAPVVFLPNIGGGDLDSDMGMAICTVCAGNVIELVFNYIWIFIFAKFAHIPSGAPAAPKAQAAEQKPAA